MYVELNRLRTLLAAPTTCLFLILILCVFPAQKPTPTGVWMPVVRLSPIRPQLSCDGRFVFIQLLADGKTKINGMEIPSKDHLTPRVSKMMESYAEPVVYLIPDSGISYARFVETLGELNKAVVDMHVVVLSGSLRDEYFQKRLDPCDIVWPN